MSELDSTFLQERITKTKALIVAYEDAILALTTGGISEYILDTGQSRQRVTKYDINSMNTTLDGLLNRCATLEARLTGSNSINARANR